MESSDNRQQEEHVFPSRGRGWLAVVVLSGLCVLSMLDRNVLVLFADQLGKDLGASDVQLSLLFGGTFSISYAIATLPIGSLLDRYPRRRVIFGCVLLWSASTILCGFARNFETMLLGRAGVGAGEAGQTPGASSILADMFEPKLLSLPTGVYMASAKAGQSLSFVFSAALAGFIPPASIYLLGGMTFKGWQVILMLVGAPGLLFAFAIFLIAEPQRQHRATGADVGYVAFFRYAAVHRRMLIPTYLGSLCYITATTAILSWSPVFLQRVHGMSVGESGIRLGGTLMLAALAGAPLHGWYVDRRFAAGFSDAHLRHLAWMGVCSLPAGVAAYLVPSGALAILLLGVFMFAIAGFTTMTAATVLLFTPRELRAKAFAIMLMINSIVGVSAGPAIAALLGEHLFHDKAAIGKAIALELALLIPIASAAFAVSLPAIRSRLKQLGVSHG